MLPDPTEVPLLRVDDVVLLVPGMGRSAVYEAVRAGDLPSVRINSRIFIPTAALRRAWGLDMGEAGSATEPAAATASDPERTRISRDQSAPTLQAVN
jgi:hypothetical protein